MSLVLTVQELPGTSVCSVARSFTVRLNFELIHEINEKTSGGVWENLARFAFKLGSNSTGPIGAFANEERTFSFVPFGRPTRTWCSPSMVSVKARLCSCEFGLQVSIDWAKRVYEIINSALYDLRDNNGNFVINFEKELTPDAIKNVLVSKTFGKVKIVASSMDVQGESKKGKTVWNKDGHKLVRVVIVDESCGWRYALHV